MQSNHEGNCSWRENEEDIKTLRQGLGLPVIADNTSANSEEENKDQENSQSKSKQDVGKPKPRSYPVGSTDYENESSSIDEAVWTIRGKASLHLKKINKKHFLGHRDRKLEVSEELVYLSLLANNLKYFELMKYDTWNSSVALIPPRSYLYSLRIQGLDASYGESLTSYIARLAQAYHVFPGILMERELAPVVNKTYGGANLHTIYRHVAALNGTGEMALNVVKALQSLTLQDKLHCLTMIPWANVFPTRGLLRSVRAWCPVCYQEWQSNSKIVYEPLVWAIDAVKVCPLHHHQLITECPQCQQPNRLLDWKSQPGYCSRCLRWLGSLQNTAYSNISPMESRMLLWVAGTVKDLLAVTPTLQSFCDKQRVAQALKFYVNRITEGNMAELARELGVPKNTFWLWCNGSNMPTLESLLKICYCLNTSLSNFLLEELKSLSQEEMVLPLLAKNKPRANAKVFDDTFLRSLQQKLQESLDSEVIPPLSMEQTAKQLGCNRRTICRHFPELCRKISDKYDSYQRTRFAEAIDQACAEVHRVVLELQAESIYPSEARVSERMNKPGYLRYNKVRAALQEPRVAAKT